MIALLAATLAFMGWALLWNRGLHQMVRLPSVPGIAFLSLFLMQFLPSLYFVLEGAMPRAEAFHLAAGLSLFSLAAGTFAGCLCFSFHGAHLRSYYAACARTPARKATRYYLVALGLVAAGILAIFIAVTPSFPLLAMLRGVDTATLNRMRYESLRADAGPISWVFGIGRAFVMPLLFASVIATWRDLRSLPARTLGVAGVVTAMLYNAWTSAKTPVAMLFVVGALVMAASRAPAAARRRGPGERPAGASNATLAVFLAIALSYPVFVFSFKSFGQDKSAGEVFVQGVLTRLFVSPAFVTYYQFELYPERFEYTYFMDIHKLATLLGEEPVNVSTITAAELFGQESRAPPCSIGVFYLQAGWPMIAVGFFITGLALVLLQTLLGRFLAPSRLNLAFVAVGCFGGFRLAMTSFHTILLTETILPLLAAAAPLAVLDMRRRRRAR